MADILLDETDINFPAELVIDPAAVILIDRLADLIRQLQTLFDILSRKKEKGNRKKQTAAMTIKNFSQKNLPFYGKISDNIINPNYFFALST